MAKGRNDEANGQPRGENSSVDRIAYRAILTPHLIHLSKSSCYCFFRTEDSTSSQVPRFGLISGWRPVARE